MNREDGLETAASYSSPGAGPGNYFIMKSGGDSFLLDFMNEICAPFPAERPVSRPLLLKSISYVCLPRCPHYLRDEKFPSF